jgi:protocatechuate 3,4-dioxygenase beta subunit
MPQHYERSKGYLSEVDDQAVAPPTEVTAATGEGPYYVANTEELPDGDLNFTHLPGQPIKVSGYFYEGAGGETPIPSARLEIWQADDAGRYHPEASGDAGRFTPEQLALRGWVTTDPSGYYEFRSIYPGKYRGRARHIHVNAAAPGYVGVFTQLIVPAKPGDDMTPEQDRVAQILPRKHLLQFTENRGRLEAGFDFRLSRA